MTNEEIVEMLQILLDNAKVGCADITVIHHVSFDSFKFVIEKAIKALEQEPCDDVVSREAILSKIKEVCFSKEWTQFRVDNGSHGQRDFLINYIEQLPSVTQKSENRRII